MNESMQKAMLLENITLYNQNLTLQEEIAILKGNKPQMMNSEGKLTSAMDNVLASRLGGIARQAGADRLDVGDSIDRGLILRRLLEENDFYLTWEPRFVAVPMTHKVMKFKDLPIGARFKYPGSDKVWIVIHPWGEGLVVGWEGLDKPRIHQSHCSFCDDEWSLDSTVEVLM